MRQFIDRVGDRIPTVIDHTISYRQKGKGWGRWYGLYDSNQSFLKKVKLILKHGA